MPTNSVLPRDTRVVVTNVEGLKMHYTQEQSVLAQNPPVLATADPSTFAEGDNGCAQVPEVLVHLVQPASGPLTTPPRHVELVIVRPDGHPGVHMTLGEAAVLRDHLAALMLVPDGPLEP